MEVASHNVTKSYSITNGCHDYRMTSSQSVKIWKKMEKIYFEELSRLDEKFCFYIQVEFWLIFTERA